MAEPVEVQETEDQASPWQQMQNRIKRDSTSTADFANTIKAERLRMESEAAQEDKPVYGRDWTIRGELARGTWGAAVNLGAELTITLNSIQETVLPVRQIYGGVSGVVDGRGWDEGVFAAQRQFQLDKGAVRQLADDITPDPKSMVGSVTEGLGQFLIPYVGWMKWAKGAQFARPGAFTEATVIGALIDGGLFDPNQGNLSNLIGELTDTEQDAVWMFLATDPDDSEATNRLRNALEGGIFGTTLEGIFKLARMGIHARKVGNARKRADADPDQMLTKEQIAEFKAKEDGPDLQFEFDELEIIKDGQGTVINAKDSGRMGLMERGGETLQVVDAQVDKALQGRGNGKKLYDAAARLADERGLKLTSDTSVSQDAVYVWESRIRAGEDITDLRKTEPDSVTKTEEIDAKGNKKVTYGSAPGKPIFVRNAAAKTADDAAEGAAKGADEAGEEAVQEGRKFFHSEHLRETLNLDATQRKMLNDALLAGDDKTASQILELHDFNIDTIDWSKVEGPEDIKRLINIISEVTSDNIDAVKGGVQTHAHTKRLGNLVGSTGDDVHKLFKDVRGDGGIAARFYGAKRAMMMAAREAQKLIQDAKANPGDLAKQSAVFRHLQLYAALQAEVKGAQVEIGRALNAMKILSDDAGEGFKEFDEIMRQFGGRQSGSRNFEKYMDSLLDALDRGDIDAFNRGVRMTTGERVKNIIVEYVINAMLSSPATHKINFLSNAVNTVLYSMDRAIAGTWRTMRHGDRAALREARIDVVRKLTGMGEAWRLARQAWKDGAPVTDMRQRLEFNTRRAISMEGTSRAATEADQQLPELGQKFFARKAEAVRDADGTVQAVVDFSWPQRAVNTLGRFVRIPGRGLITGDEFFKAINRNAEQSVLAFRTADDEAMAEGLRYGTDAYEKFIKKRTRSLLDPKNDENAARNVRSLSIEQARKAAFQESPTTGFGAAAEKFVNSNRFFKLVLAPFFRTPMNILRQGSVDRMPWGRWIGETREIIQTGHPRARSEAIARTYTGMAFMAGSYMAMSNLSGPDGYVEIVGKVNFDSSARDTQRKDYSIRLGKTWYQFNRLDPVGLWLGITSDLHTAIQNAEDEDEPAIEALGQAMMGTFLGNIINKTWMKSAQDILDWMETAGNTNISDESQQRAFARMAGGQLGKFIPQFVKTTGRNVEAQVRGEETAAREAWTAIDVIKSTLPVFNRDLPQRYDSLGRPKTYPTQGITPLQKSPQAQTPVDRELQRLDFTLKPMQKSLVGGNLQLTAEEYSEMNRLVGTIKMADGTLEETLNKLIESPAWKTFNDYRKVYEIKLRIKAARTAARALMLKDEKFRKKYTEAVKENPLALLQE